MSVATVKPGDMAPEAILYGRVQTSDLLQLAASAPARVARVEVRDGDRVAKGQLLLQLDQRDLLPTVNQAQADVEELKAQILSEKNRLEGDRAAIEQEQRLLSIAEDGVERARRLAKRQVGSETDLDKAEEALARQRLALTTRQTSIEDHPARLRALEARLRRARAHLSEVELDLKRSTVQAPFDAIVAGVEVTAGDLVKQDEVLLKLYASDSLEVRARIPAPLQAEAGAALASGAELPATAEIGGKQVSLRLARIAGEAQPSGIDGLFSVQDEAQLLRLGQLVSLRLQRPKRSSTIALPYQAVYGEGRIYRLEDGRMRVLDVETLGGVKDSSGEERLLVRSEALSAGDQVVVTHMPNAVDGLRVEVVP